MRIILNKYSVERKNLGSKSIDNKENSDVYNFWPPRGRKVIANSPKPTKFHNKGSNKYLKDKPLESDFLKKSQNLLKTVRNSDRPYKQEPSYKPFPKSTEEGILKTRSLIRNQVLVSRSEPGQLFTKLGNSFGQKPFHTFEPYKNTNRVNGYGGDSINSMKDNDNPFLPK